MSARGLMLVALTLLMGGCASTHLQVSIDLYKGDPRFIEPPSREDAIQLIENMEALQQAATDRTSERQFLATAARDLYLTTWKESGAPYPSSETLDLDKRYHAYIGATNRALARLEPKLAAALTAVKDYLSAYQREYADAVEDFTRCERSYVSGKYLQEAASLPADCYANELPQRVERPDSEWILRRLAVSLAVEEANAREAVKRAQGAFESFAKPTATETIHPESMDLAENETTDATGAFEIDWVGLRGRLYATLEAAQRLGVHSRENALTRAIQSFNTGMLSLAERSKLVPKSKIAAARDPQLQHSPGGLLDATVRIAVELESLRADLPQSASAQTALAGLARNSGQFTELIDRLQDTGDPAWRTVTDPANESHWNRLPRAAEWYAEGKTSVVFVRSDPMRFDVHDATNNPTALIKGQLEVSRAVTNAAISVAGAAIGLPAKAALGSGTTTPASTTTSTTPATGSDTTSNPGVDYAKRKATAEETQRLRDREIRGLDLELTTISASLSSGSDNVPDTLKNRLSALLTAYKSIFDTPSTN